MASRSLMLCTALLCCSCSTATEETSDADAGTGADASTLPGPADAALPIRPDAQTMQPDAMPSCPDPSESNDTPQTATMLNDINDCDNNGGSLSGASINLDEDWFTFVGSDAALCTVNPAVSFTGNVRVCMYFECTNGTADVTCPADTVPPGSGPEGCCGTSDFTIGDFNCVGPISDDATVLIQVSALSSDVCESYSVDYHY